MNEILLEYYQGRPKELIKCEGYIREIIKLIREDHDGINPMRSRQVYREAEPCKKLEKELAKFFNVAEIHIYWKNQTVNAYTMPPFSFCIGNYKNNYLAGRFSDIRMHICVYEEVVYLANLTEQEVLATILHEIGHNFYFCPIKACYDLMYAIVTLPIGIIMNFIAKGFEILSSEVDNWAKKNIPFVYNVLNTFYDIVNNANSLCKGLNVAYALLNAIIQVATGNIDLIGGIVGYGGEKGADSFAAKYGYGPELVSGLTKMSEPEELLGTKIKDAFGPLGSVMSDLSCLGIDLISAMTLNPHPNHNQRAQSLLKKLRNDLAKGDYPPAAKRDLENEIKRMEKMSKIVNDSAVGGRPGVKQAWYNMANTITKGHTDIRELLNFYFDPLAF